MSTTINVGIIGIGRAGWGMHTSEMGKYPDYFNIVSACDIEQERVDMMTKKYNCAGHTDIHAFVNDANMDLVSIATRSPEHPEHARIALEAGKYVFLEKPVAVTEEGAQAIAELDKQFPGKLFFRHNRRFEPAFTHIREIIKSGIIGDVFEIKLRRHGYQRRQDWQTIIECGGGQLNNWGPHLIDHALQFIESPVANVWGNLKRVACAGDAEDHLKVIVTGESGIVVDIEISGGAALSDPVYTVHGTKGSLICADEQDIQLKYLEPDQKLSDLDAIKESPSLTASFGNNESLKWRRKTIMVEPSNGCDTSTIWEHLYKAIREDVPFPITTEQALAVVNVTNQVKAGTSFEMKQACMA